MAYDQSGMMFMQAMRRGMEIEAKYGANSKEAKAAQAKFFGQTLPTFRKTTPKAAPTAAAPPQRLPQQETYVLTAEGYAEMKTLKSDCKQYEFMRLIESGLPLVEFILKPSAKMNGNHAWFLEHIDELILFLLDQELIEVKK